MHVVDSVSQLFAAQHKASSRLAVELDALCAELGACRCTSVAEHETVETLCERILEAAAKTLVSVYTREQQGSDATIRQRVLNASPTPKPRQATLVNQDVLWRSSVSQPHGEIGVPLILHHDPPTSDCVPIWKLHWSNLRAQTRKFLAIFKVGVGREPLDDRRWQLFEVLLCQAPAHPHQENAGLPACWDHMLNELVHHFQASTVSGPTQKGG